MNLDRNQAKLQSLVDMSRVISIQDRRFWVFYCLLIFVFLKITLSTDVVKGVRVGVRRRNPNSARKGLGKKNASRKRHL